MSTDRGRAARWWHLLTFVVGAASLLVQLVLVIVGDPILLEENQPGLGAQLGQFIGYFTVQSNLVAAAVVFTLLRRPDRDGPFWRVARIAGVIAMTITAVVHWFLLRPLLNLEGLSWLVDKGLHVVTPVLLVVGWLLFGPRPRVSVRDVLLALIWPLLWLLVILLQAQLSGWYPYPFLDAGTQGADAVVIACIGITALFVVVGLLARLLDRRLRPAPCSQRH